MTVLLIILAIIGFFISLFSIRPTVRIRVQEEISIVLNVLFFKIKLLPKKEKKPNLKSFKIKNFRRMRLKEEKRLLRKAKKSDKKEKKKANKAEKQAENEEKPSLKENVQYVLELVKYVLLKAISKFGKHLRIQIRELDITVSGEDAAKTAITYGYVIQAVSYIKELADNSLNVSYPKNKNGNIAVRVDYLSGKTVIKLDISFGIRIWQAFSVLIAGLRGYVLDVGKKKTKASEKGSSKINKENNKIEIKKEPAEAGMEVQNGRQ